MLLDAILLRQNEEMTAFINHDGYFMCFQKLANPEAHHCSSTYLFCYVDINSNRSLEETSH